MSDEAGITVAREPVLLGVLRERAEGERRVALVPGGVLELKKLGFDVIVEASAGVASGYEDEVYVEAGARIGSAAEVRASQVVVKVRAPTDDVEGGYRDGATLPFEAGSLLISLLSPADNKELIEGLAKADVDAIALERIPRISRAQKMDVLSSMGNIAGYRAVLEAAVTYEGFFGASVTAAGTIPPAKVLIIGAGVAGLQAIAAARALGAEVRAFDVRPDCAEQVESLGAKFLMLDFDESGEGEGGYAKIMSKEFIDAEMALFAEQAEEVDIVITTALIPGRKAPVLITTPMVESMKKGSIVVDLAARSGGNCELTKTNEAYVHGGVHILGYLNLPSRMAHTASRFFSGNIVHLLKDMVGDEGFAIDLEDEVVRGALQTHGGKVLEPPPRRAPPPKPEAQTPVHVPKKKAKKESGAGSLAGGAIMLGVFALVGLFAPASFVPHFGVFVLACFIGWQVVWSVSASLHTPLMSVTNAISGIILVGGMLQAGSGESNLPTILGALALFFASINVFGGFTVTARMLKMFQRGS
jgi:NAD(P) transhydrogenase subunit alpha